MTKRFSEEQINPILKEAEAGLPIKELCRKYNILDATFYMWRKKYGGMEVSEGDEGTGGRERSAEEAVGESDASID